MNTSAFPIENPLDQHTLAHEFERLVETRCASQAWHFCMAVPRGFERVRVPADVPTTDAPQQLLARLVEPLRREAEIEVGGVLLDREVAPADWLRLRLEDLGETILHERELPSITGPALDVVSVSAGPGPKAVSRRLAFKDGNRLFVFEGRATADAYAEHAAEFLTAMQTLRPLHPSPWPLAETLSAFARGVPTEFALLYPDSWILTEDPEPSENVSSAQLHHLVHGERVGSITFASVRRTVEADPQHLAESYLDELRRVGLDVPPITLAREPDCAVAARPGLPPASPFDELWTGGDPGALAGNVDLRVTVGIRADALYLFGQLGPSRRAAPRLWAIHKRAHALCIERMRFPG
jgi:hypothetical protein